MQIEVLKVDVENKGKYRQAKVSYKRDDGKVDAKFLVSFANKDVYKTMTQTQPTDAFYFLNLFLRLQFALTKPSLFFCALIFLRI